MGSQHQLPISRRLRGVNSRGEVDIYCSVCGAFICRMIFSGFMTAICLKCQGVTVPESAEEARQRQLMEDTDLYSKEEKSRFTDRIAQTIQSTLRAVGLFPTSPVPEEEAPIPDGTVAPSKDLAKAKRRKSLFGTE